MPISGLAIILSSDPAQAGAAVDAMNQHTALTLGPREGNRIAIVVETACSEEDREVWHWLHDLPGVRQVDVACVHFADEHDPASDMGENLEGIPSCQ